MSNIIKLLPDSVANQIAAGEVVQRPASVVKELLENAVDAGATSIKLIVKEAGRTLVQVIDNGSGMTEMDARMAFERHATSKITEATDLFCIQTKGFRGEALASIAAVAQVELRTRKKGEELGTLISIAASKFDDQETIHCPEGSNFAVRNLFFNIPARRKFLKQNATEFRHILNEFERVVLAHPEVEFSLIHNDVQMFMLPIANLRQRIVNLAGKQANTSLIPIEADTHFVKVHGYIGKPEASRKTTGDQFFFVNNRFIRHPYLHKAVMDAYSNLISADSLPMYYIYMDMDPQTIDINIHPTKTEIKFEDERTIWHILNAAVRESLGKFNIVPSIDFDTEGIIPMPIQSRMGDVIEPEITINPEYNPFEMEKGSTPYYSGGGGYIPRPSTESWEELYKGFETETFRSKIDTEQSFDDMEETEPAPPVQQTIIHQNFNEQTSITSSYFQFKGKYILSSSKSGLMLIDQKRAHERILFERFLNQMDNHQSASQQILFPEVLTFKSEDAILLSELTDELMTVGIHLEENEDGDFEVHGLPADLHGINVRHMLESILEDYRSSEFDAALQLKERLAGTLARNSAIGYGKPLSVNEMQELFDQLFACSKPNFTPDGKTIVVIVPSQELESRFE
jgi:DNA mismatch repair protein MutL